MIKNFFRTHQWKFFWGAPIIFLVIVNSSGALHPGNFFQLFSTTQAFVQVGDTALVSLRFQTNTPINALGGVVAFSPGVIEVDSLDRTNSMIDLWSEEPSYANQDGTIQFSGGMVDDKSSAPSRGDIFTFSVRMIGVGTGAIEMKNAELLASNGEGTNVASGQNTLTFYIRKKGTASPDVNGDGVLSITDVNTLYLKTFRSYDEHYDLNGDRKINWTDVKTLIALF